MIYLLYNEWGAGLVYITFGLLVLLHILLFGYGYLTINRAVLQVALLALPAHLLTALLLGGYSHSHGVILWGLFFPVLET